MKNLKKIIELGGFESHNKKGKWEEKFDKKSKTFCGNFFEFLSF